jgi:two-component system LytT family response regulator
MTIAALPARPAFLNENTYESPGFSPAKKIRTLIVDDQLLEREVMRRLLKDESDIEIVGISTNGKEAVESIVRLKPDLVFLDVQMPELDGFGVVSQIAAPNLPVIVFVTANEEFARKAFDVQALDYLIKPCERSRLAIALQRVREEINRKRTGALQQRLSDLLMSDLTAAPRQVDRLVVRSEGRILFLRLPDIHWIEAAENTVSLYTAGEVHSLRETLTQLESRLPSGQFLRISRSAIVNIEQIKEMHPQMHGEYLVMLHNGTRLALTGNYCEKIQQLGL